MNSAPIATRHFLHSGNNPAMTLNQFILLIMTWLPQLQHLALSFAVPYIPTETIARTRNMRISTVTPIALLALETADPSGAKSDPTESATAPTETTTSNLFNCRLVSFVASGNRILSIGIVAIFIIPLHSPHSVNPPPRFASQHKSSVSSRHVWHNAYHMEVQSRKYPHIPHKPHGTENQISKIVRAMRSFPLYKKRHNSKGKTIMATANIVSNNGMLFSSRHTNGPSNG